VKTFSLPRQTCAKGTVASFIRCFLEPSLWQTAFMYSVCLEQVPSDLSLFDECLSASISHVLATGERKGKRVRRIGWNAKPPEVTSAACATSGGFSLHANTFIPAYQTHRLEALCRYICRPALSLERLSWQNDDSLAYELKTPYRDGTTHVIFSPHELIEKLIALIPPPKAHLIRYHGLWAPHAKNRPEIIPSQYEKTSSCDSDKPISRFSWAKLLKRTFDIDLESCSSCGAQMKIISAITEKPVIRQILRHLGLGPDPPNILPAQLPNSHHDLFYDYAMDTSV
jgi:hypothetical protein